MVLWDLTSVEEGNETLFIRVWYRARHWVVWQRKRWILKGGGLWDPIPIGEGNKTFFIRVWYRARHWVVWQRERWVLKGGWIVRSHIGWRGEQNNLYKGVEISPQQTYFKIVRLTSIRNGLKQTISGSSEFRLLLMVWKADTEWCASEDVGPWRRVDCEIPHRLERWTKHPL